MMLCSNITIDKPKISPEILDQLQAKILEEKQVIVHCCFPATVWPGMLIRIWPSTFLIDRGSGHRSKLLHAENIAVAPSWLEVAPFADHWFTLIFSGLPPGCKNFDLAEIIAEEGGFFVSSIARNESDVYRVKIS